MEQLKPYAVPLVALAILGAWFFVFKPGLEGDTEQGAEDAKAEDAEKAEPAPKPDIVVLDPLVQGELGAPVITPVVEDNLDTLRECYEASLAKNPNLKGRVMIQINIRGEGTVRAASIAGSQIKDESVGRCFTQKMADWTFPESDGGGSTVATYPFQLAPG
jgi:hypothetical protein